LLQEYASAASTAREFITDAAEIRTADDRDGLSVRRYRICARIRCLAAHE
jgi:hypothetical protein